MALNPKQLAQARSRTYTLLSHLYMHGLTAVTLPTVRALPSLAAGLSERFVADEAAAMHYHLFAFHIYPYASVFVDRSGLLGGDITEQVAQHYRQIGYVPSTAVASPDHIGCELGALAFLCGAETDAWEDGLTAVAQQMRQQQKMYLQTQLLRWLSPFVVAIRQQGDAFFTAVAELTLELASEHIANLDTEHTVLTDWRLPDKPDLLNKQETGLKEIADFLMTPPLSGLYLGRDDIGHIAQQLDLPRGFGERRQMLRSLMHTAVQYDQFPQFLAVLQQVVTSWGSHYQTMAEAFPEMAVFTAVWHTHLKQTHTLLLQIESQFISSSADNVPLTES